jgi:hypothetical protein
VQSLKADPSPDAKALRASLVSFSGQLHWHCHFMQKLESEPAIEFREFHPAMRGLRRRTRFMARGGVPDFIARLTIYRRRMAAEKVTFPCEVLNRPSACLPRQVPAN